MPGMRRSSSSRSAGLSRRISKSSSPLDAEPATSTPACVPSILVRPASTTGWSSTIRMRIGAFRRSGIDPMLLYIFPEQFWPGGECNARRQRRGYLDTRALARLALDLEGGRDALGASAHAANAEAQQAVALYKACAVVFYLQAGQVLAVLEPDGQEGRIRMPDGIGYGLLSDSVEGIRDSQGNGPLVAFSLRNNLNRTAFHHAPGAKVQSGEYVLRLQRLGAKRSNAAARLLVAVAYEVAGQIELLQQGRIVLGDSVANRLQLESNAGKTLRQGVVHLVGQTLTLLQYALEPPMRDAVVNEVDHQRDQERDDNNGNDVSRAPPGRTGEDFQVLIGTQQKDERSEILRERWIDNADAAQAETAVQSELAEKIVAAPWIHDGAERLRPLIEIQNQRIVRSVLFAGEASLHLDEFGVEFAGGCLGCRY